MKKISELLTHMRGFEDKANASGKKLTKTFENIENKLDNKMKAIDKKFEKLEIIMEEKTKAWERIFGNEKRADIALEAYGVKRYFARRGDRRQILRAVDGVDFIVPRGETLGIVGESGCGKSTVARVMIGLLPATEGVILLDGESVSTRVREKRSEIRRRTGIVFQDPYGSMDPRMTVADIVGEPLRAHRLTKSKSDRLLLSLEILELCGMRGDDLFKYPHQFSGGQRQRICIARALIANPDIVVCDEAVSALDVSIQAQIINLLCDLKQQRGLTYLFISHDLEVVRFITDRVAVMYLGKVVETANKEELFENPLHPYTKMLLDSAPVFGKKREPDYGGEYDGDFVQDMSECDADISDTYMGCRFRARCRMAKPECGHDEPELRIRSNGHAAACHFT